MKKRFLRLLFLSGTLLTLLTACEYDLYCTNTSTATSHLTDDTISYSQDIQPIFNAKCVTCHAGSITPDLTAGQSYNALCSGNLCSCRKSGNQ